MIQSLLGLRYDPVDHPSPLCGWGAYHVERPAKHQKGELARGPTYMGVLHYIVCYVHNNM